MQAPVAHQVGYCHLTKQPVALCTCALHTPHYSVVEHAEYEEYFEKCERANKIPLAFHA